MPGNGLGHVVAHAQTTTAHGSVGQVLGEQVSQEQQSVA